VAKSGLTLSLKKCHLAYQSITALDTIRNLGIGTADGTFQAVKSFPQPTNLKELQRFLNVFSDYASIIDCSTPILAHPQYDRLFILYRDCGELESG
jgi:hypothetical protein